MNTLTVREPADEVLDELDVPHQESEEVEGAPHRQRPPTPVRRLSTRPAMPVPKSRT